MRILWVCNMMLPAVAEYLHREAGNKEGWLTGLSGVILERQKENGIVLGAAFPVEKELDGYRATIPVKGAALVCYGFYEDTGRAERYDKALEEKLSKIVLDFQPDVVHCFGTEYGHTLAVSRVFPEKNRILISIQGLCAVYANTYLANLPEYVVRRVTLRDLLKRDSLLQQRRKFVLRGEMEKEAIRNAGNVTGRTLWDKYYTREWNPSANYFSMNETLRPDFYSGRWDPEQCEPYTIFLSQGDYPVKGLHYMLLALPGILTHYPQAKVCVAGNSLVKDSTWKDRLKLSSYGKYLRDIIRENHLQDRVVFLGRLNVAQMKAQYLRSGLFVCCSTIENSPNSLGEAMMLGVPCVSADVGGIPSLFVHLEDGILYPGFRTKENSFDNVCDENGTEQEQLENNVEMLKNAIVKIWKDSSKIKDYSHHARLHAKETHNRERNYCKMMEIYAEIIAGGAGERKGNEAGIRV